MAIVLRRTAEFESNVVARVRGERNEEMEQLRRKLVEAMEESNLLRRHLEDARIELRVQEEELRRRHEDEAMRTRLLESLTTEQSRTRRCVDKLWTALQLRLQEEKVDNGDIGASLNGDDSGIEEICRQLLVLLQRHDEDAISDKKKGINDALPHLHNKITTKVRDIEAQTEDTVTLPAPPPHLLRSLLLSLSALRASTAAIKQDLTLQVLNLEDSCRMHINQILALVLKNSK